MSAKKRRITAAELLAQLDSDADYQAQRRVIEEGLASQEQEWVAAQQDLIFDLAAVGVAVSSVWDLVPRAEPYPEAIPVLLDHVGRDYPDRVKEGIARSLAVREAEFGWERLVAAYRSSRNGPDAKDGLAVALAAIATPVNLDEMIALIDDPTNEESRGILLLALFRMGAEGRAKLEALKSDPVLGKEARRLLGSGEVH